MSKVEFFEEALVKDNGKVGKIAVFRGGLNAENPTALISEAVSSYVGKEGHNQFVEIHLDNPWVRIVITGINDLPYNEYTNQTVK